MINTNLGQVAYEAYRSHTGGKSLATGDPIPEWADLREAIQDAWCAAAAAVSKPDVALNRLSAEVHGRNEKWWKDLQTGEPLKRNVGEMLMLVVSEVAEALEGHRKNLPDDKLPHRPMIEVELADAVIRIFDMSAGLGLDLGGAFVEKLAFNAQRIDHTHEHRLGENGKKY